MPISKKQVSTTIDKQHHERYKAICGELGSMADLRRAAHNLYLNTYDLRRRVLRKYYQNEVYLSEVDPIRKLLLREFYTKELTLVNSDNDYSRAG